MSSCVSAVLISLVEDKHLSPRQLKHTMQPALHNIGAHLRSSKYKGDSIAQIAKAFKPIQIH